MRSIPSPFRSGLLIRSSPRNPTLHFAFIASIHLSTAQLREILISISQASFIPFSPSPFPTHFQRYIFIFCGVFAPKNRRPQFSPPPCSCCISGNRLLFHVLAVGAFIPAPLRCGNYVRSSLRTPTLHYAFIHASTSAPHSISSSILSLHIFRSFSPYLCHYPPISSGCLHSCGGLAPIKRILLVLIRNGFFFQKDSKRQIQKGLFEYNIYRQKNKKSSKDKAANTDQRFGQ